MTTPPEVDPVVWEALKQLVTDEKNGALLPLSIGPYSAYTMLGALQLAWRHPDMEPRMKQIIRGFGEQLASAFSGGPLAESCAQGWDTAHDVEKGSEVKHVYLWDNNVVMVFNGRGEQIPELQGRFSPHIKEALLKVADPATHFYHARWGGDALLGVFDGARQAGEQIEVRPQEWGEKETQHQ